MGVKFRRRQKLFPGVYLNFSAKGVSTTIGIKGFNVNLGNQGAYLNTGLPGTGLYDRKKITGIGNSNSTTTTIPEQNNAFQNTPTFDESEFYFIPKKLEGEIKSKDANSVTSVDLAEVKETLLAAYKEKTEIENEISVVKKDVKKASNAKLISQIFIIGLITKKFKYNLSEKIEYLNELEKQLLECKVNIDIDITAELEQKYQTLKQTFDTLSSCSKIWDKTSAVKNNDNRSAANSSVTRTATSLSYKKVAFINSDFDALHFKNQNGSDIYIFPAFAVLFDDKNNFGLVELKDLEITFGTTGFLEEEGVPHDTKQIGETWAKVNKDGTPDRRFKDNYQIPIVEYGEITFKSNTGIFEVFMLSNTSKALTFVECYNNYFVSA